jgi:hypothetical protein
MGKLSLNSKLFNSLIFKPFESKNIVFEGPSGTTMGNFINVFDIFNVDSNGIVNMFIGDLNTSPLITFISDGNDWLNLVTEENVSNYVIPLNAIFQINSTSNLLALLNLGGNVSNYFQGQASIKKQNLGGGKLNLRPRVYAYKATGTGLSPNINNLRFYDTGLIRDGQPIYYDETKVYWLAYVSNAWIIALIGTLGGSGLFVKFGGTPVGSYSGSTGYSGTVTISAI